MLKDCLDLPTLILMKISHFDRTALQSSLLPLKEGKQKIWLFKSYISFMLHRQKVQDIWPLKKFKAEFSHDIPMEFWQSLEWHFYFFFIPDLHIFNLGDSCLTMKGFKCVFPFKYERQGSYSFCPKMSNGHTWCATSVEKNGKWKTWDFCKRGECQNKGTV